MKKYLFILILPIILSFSNCENRSEAMEEIEISVCGTENPAWLLSEISKITELRSHRPVKVSFYIDGDTEIVSIEDPVNSNFSEGLMFFYCNGERIEFNSEKHNQYLKLLKHNKFTLLWSN